LLKEVSPPALVTAAIERKQAQQQEAEAMKFKLESERLEAERKEIEAKGIQKFQEIVKKGIDSNLLAWKGIEATEKLAKSKNAKIVVIGNKGTSGMPLIIPTN
jgi:regulator of protease activity HflC (stomatin/prohibitin superfamily)